MAGAILEIAVVNEIVHSLTHGGEEPQICFWRTSTGTEVDVVVDTGARPADTRRPLGPHTVAWPFSAL